MSETENIQVLKSLAKTDSMMLDKLEEIARAHNQLHNDCLKLANIINQQTERIIILENMIQDLRTPSLS